MCVGNKQRKTRFGTDYIREKYRRNNLSMEIFIPVEAEVKKILLWSLPNSVLRKMGLPLSNAEGCRTFPESPEGIWISPVVLRRKGQKHKPLTGNTMGSMSSVIGTMSQVTPVPYPISFVSSSDMAYKVLKDTMPGQTVPFHSFHISELLVTPAPHTHQDAVVIYQDRVYLSIRRLCQTQHLAQTYDPQHVSMASITSTTDTSSKSRKHTQASLESPNMEIQRPCVASKHSKEASSTRYEEHLHDNNTKNKIITWKGTCSKTKQDIASSMTARSAIQCTDWVDDVSCKQSAEQVSVRKEAWIHLQREQKDNEIKLGV
ncbi:uncharacterized protein si:dkeyp-110g5.4 isoform X2 [Antennarius striatus]|uniref:uncharacterized protein si:dkeyp-110g5.4 isoform X2 n=1 Tax=Antennarius striatus TaxID=241820 RepID=UPI0035B4BEBE